MGRRRKENTIKSIHQKMAQGRGAGSGESYKPGIYVYEIASKGKVARVKGETTGRVHHCLSQHEKYFLMLLDYDPAVTEIREQYLLDLQETLLIAAETGLKHPYADQCPAVMSTDFFYCRDGTWYAVAVKTAEDLKKNRTLKKLEIERIYWERKGIPWRIVTEQDIPRQKAINLQWLHSGEAVETLIPDPVYRQNLTDSFLELYQDYAIPFAEMIDTIESYCKLVPGTMLQMFKHLILEGRIQIDLSEPINTIEPRSVSRAYTREGS